jgi:hypothetical protein
MTRSDRLGNKKEDLPSKNNLLVNSLYLLQNTTLLKKPHYCLIKNFRPPLFAFSKGARKEVIDGLVTARSGTIVMFSLQK